MYQVLLIISSARTAVNQPKVSQPWRHARVLMCKRARMVAYTYVVSVAELIMAVLIPILSSFCRSRKTIC